jgi:hypothetical protein
MTSSAPARPDVIVWNHIVPRLGIIYALTQDDNTRIKASYGSYIHQIGARLAATANPNGRAMALYAMEDANGNGLLDEGEIDFNSPLAVNLPAANQVDPDIAPATTRELTLSLEHDLDFAFGVAVHFIYRKDQRLIDDVNPGVPFEQYEPVQALDPGLDLIPGTEDDQVMTVFNQSPESLGQDRFLLTNPEGFEGDYTGLRLEARRLLHRSWQMMASFSLGRSRGFLPGPGWESFEGSGFATPLYDNPNTLIHAHGKTFWDRNYVFRVSGSYADFVGFKLGGSFRLQGGQPLYRSILVDRSLGGESLNQGIIEVLADAQGFARHPRVLLIDARVEREFDLGRFGRLGLIGDVFNLLNANTVTEFGQRASTFGTVHEILAPRVLRIGLRYRF